MKDEQQVDLQKTKRKVNRKGNKKANDCTLTLKREKKLDGRIRTKKKSRKITQNGAESEHVRRIKLNI